VARRCQLFVVNEPVVASIVIPAYNAAGTIDVVLGRIAAQASVIDFEVIVADNGSTDCTCRRVEAWTDRLPIRIVDASARPRQAAARNIGAWEARGDLLVFTDSDDAVMPGWLDAWRALDPAVEFASGPVVVFDGGDDPPEHVSSAATRLPIHMGFLSYALGTNFAVRRTRFETIGGFDESMPPAEDVELSWRLQVEGVELAFVPEALVAKRERSSVRAIVRQYYAYGLRDPALYYRYRSAGVHRAPTGETLKSYAGLLVRLPLLYHRGQRVKWGRQIGRRAGRLVGSARTRAFYP
jgi:glycosyltransferase involved in cell wall biosynthesis